MEDQRIILRTNGLPFATERAADLRIEALAKEGKIYQRVSWEVEDDDGEKFEGYALERTDTGRRPERIPVGSRSRLTAPKRPGYKRRWVNNNPGRLSMFEQAGYKVVQKKDFDPDRPGVVVVGDHDVSRSTSLGSGVVEEVGGGKKAVLMEIRKDWFDQDQLTKSKKLDQMERQIKRRPNQDGYYGDIDSDFDTRDPKKGSAPNRAVDVDQGMFE